MRATLLIAAAVFATATAPAFAQPSAVAGRPIVDLIERLRDAGARIVYSDDLLPARLRAMAEPTAVEPFDQLREILTPHGLDVELGPRETWLIVRRASEPPPTPTDSRPPARPVLTPPTLETIVVTTSRYAIERSSATSATTIGRHTLEITPALGQDPLRVTQILPGVTSNQLSSQMHIRGGRLDEVLLRLDGVRLYSPYHLKDFQTIFSSINPHVIESIDVRTGGYEARFGDGLSGVVDMTPIEPTEFRRHELGVGLLETSVLSSGLFDQGRGSWLTSLRRGNLDILSNAADSDFGRPQYVDFFNKLEYSLSSRSTVGFGLFSLDDKITLNEGIAATATADYDDAYYWLDLQQSFESGLTASYQLSQAELSRQRIGSLQEPNRAIGSLAEKSDFNRTALTADWGYSLSDALQISWGIELAKLHLDYAFQSARTELLAITAADLTGPNAPPSASQARFNRTTRAFYMSYRVRPVPRFVAELGYRLDQQSITNERQSSPRVSLLFDLADRTSLRAAWGRYSQAHSLDQIEVSDGLTSPQLAEESDHLVFGLEHQFLSGIAIRFEGYAKSITKLNPRFENLFERVSLVPELLPDRFRLDPLSARVKGFEFSVAGGNPPFGWWANFARSRTNETLRSGRFERSWDELWAAKAGGEWSGPKWIVTASATFRSGWPISSVNLVNGNVQSGSFNAMRLADFSSLDARASRTAVTQRGDLIWYIEVSNLLNHANYCCVDYRFQPGSGSAPDSLRAQSDDLLGIIPNIGLRWAF